MMGDLVGQQLGDYKLTHLFGKGGMAEVYLGKHVNSGMEAAIKVWQAYLPGEMYEQFHQEIIAIAGLAHPNIVPVRDFGVVRINGMPFLVMDYAPKGSLLQKFPRGQPVDPVTLAPYVQQIADALHYAHEQGIIHRNLKPENVLRGAKREALLSDFGMSFISSLQGQNMQVQNIQAAVPATAYMAPEQIQGQAVPASDQYALAAMIYEWLTGSPPLRDQPQPLRQKIPTLSQDVNEVVMTALEKETKNRYASIQAFAKAFEAASKQGKPSGMGAKAGQTPGAVPVPARVATREPAIAAAPAKGMSGQPPKALAPANLGGRGQAVPPGPPKVWIPFNNPPAPPDDPPPSAGFLSRLAAPVLPGTGGPAPRRLRKWMLALAALLVVVLGSGSLIAYLASGNHSRSPRAVGTTATQAVSKGSPHPTTGSPTSPTPTATSAPLSGNAIDVQPSHATNVPQSQQASAMASCPTNEQLVGGGYALQAGNDAYTADASYPAVSGPWTATITNNTAQTMTIIAYALCLQSAPALGGHVVQGDPTTVADGSTQAATAACPAGEVVTGGGFLTTPASSGVVVSSRPSDALDGWTISTKATTGSMAETAYALCASKKHLADATHPTQSLPVPKASTRQLTISCSANQLLTGGGFSDSDAAGDGENFFYANMPAADKTSWMVSVDNNDANTAHGATIWAVCVTVS